MIQSEMSIAVAFVFFRIGQDLKYTKEQIVAISRTIGTILDRINNVEFKISCILNVTELVVTVLSFLLLSNIPANAALDKNATLTSHHSLPPLV
mmetsp:Transcript_23567/g.34750  ORF Transcript_23567/g.34750 Transcript_23567/m.34750 type:complete len:94 (+) Transcript_23567:739-1020(+)